MNIEREFLLLLTAAVDPKGMPGVTEPDPAQREETYARCLTYYLTDHSRVRKIVFAENSGWPLDRFYEIASCANPQHKEIEILSFNCNDFPRKQGKCYGELLLMDKALQSSRLAENSRYIGKMTGRNLLLNLTALLESALSDFEFCCDIRDHNFYELLGMPDCGHHVDSRFFVFTPGFYESYLKGAYSRFPFGNGYMIEGLLYDVVKAVEHAEPVVKRFAIEPNYRGTAGHFMKNKTKDYGSTSEIIKRGIRSCSRRFAPWLHI